MEGLSPPDKSPPRITGMFDSIAPRYDLLNHLLSAGMDRRWRARAVSALALAPGMRLLDLCTGTADIALTAARGVPGASVLGVDFSGAMLRIGLAKVRRAHLNQCIRLVQGDAARVPVGTASCDAASVAFGIRNVQQPELALAELARVLKPGGRLAILEFGQPRIPGIRTLYRWYFKYVLPRVGRRVSKHGSAYSYLPASVDTFPAPPEFARAIASAGFTGVRPVPLTFGIVYLYTAQRQ